MGEQLDSARSMLARAQVHTTTFKDAVMAFLDSDPFVQVNEVDPATGERVLKLKLVKTAPKELNHIAADALVNMRSALDQAGYAVSNAAGGKGKDTYFPVGDTRAEVLSRRGGGSKEIPQAIFDVMASFNPYRGGDDLLWSLCKLCNINKHRLLNTMASKTANQTKLTFIGNKGSAQANFQFRIPRWDSVNNELELCRYTAGSSDDYQLGFEVRTLVSFGEIDVLDGHPAEGVLNLLVGKIESILSAVDAEAQRIGLFK